MACIDCTDPPPDMILSMPPPPLPSFLLPKSTGLAGGVAGNDTQQPCFAAFMCEVGNAGPREQSGIEFIELSHKDDTWLFILVSAGVCVVLFGSLLAMILLKCKQSYSYYHDSAIKQPPPVDGTLTQGKSHPGTMLYPFVPTLNYQNRTLGNDNRMLWATLTPHGTTQHFVVPPEDHYEVIDYCRNPEKYQVKRATVKNSFENSGFVDFDYEEPTPLMHEAYNTDDIDSGYQEPQNVSGNFSENSLRRAYVSTPTRIENPNMAPLNLQRNVVAIGSGLEGNGGSLSKRSTISRRISDVSNRSPKI